MCKDPIPWVVIGRAPYGPGAHKLTWATINTGPLLPKNPRCPDPIGRQCLPPFRQAPHHSLVPSFIDQPYCPCPHHPLFPLIPLTMHSISLHAHPTTLYKTTPTSITTTTTHLTLVFRHNIAEKREI